MQSIRRWRKGEGWLTASEAYAVLGAVPPIPTAPLEAWASSGPNGDEGSSLTVSEQPVLHRSGVYDLMIEAFDDLQFGPVIRLGFGIPGCWNSDIPAGIRPPAA